MTTKIANGPEFVARLISEIQEGSSAKFASFIYTAKGSGEVARHTIILNADTRTLYEKDMVKLAEISQKLDEAQAAHMALTPHSPNNFAMLRGALDSIIKSRQESLDKGIGNNSRYVHGPELGDTYVTLGGMRNVKVHKETGNVHVTGLKSSKEVITPGTYKKVVSKPWTIARNDFLALLPSSRFREFVLENVTTARLNGETLELVTF